MEKCPQCDADRVPEDDFCDECGHKFATASEPQSQPEPQSLEDYEKDYVERVNAGDGKDDSTSEPEINAVVEDGDSTASAAIWIPGQDGADEVAISFEDNPKTVGRSDVSELLKSQNKDPTQVSRNQFTMFKEADSYYIEDGVTPVQEKASGNHTTLNGKDITEQGKQELHDGDKIGIATILDVTFRTN